MQKFDINKYVRTFRGSDCDMLVRARIKQIIASKRKEDGETRMKYNRDVLKVHETQTKYINKEGEYTTQEVYRIGGQLKVAIFNINNKIPTKKKNTIRDTKLEGDHVNKVKWS